MVTNATESLLLSGKPDPTLEKRLEALRRGYKEVLNSDIGSPPHQSKLTAAEFEMGVRQKSLEWRGRLQHLDKVTLQQWQVIQDTEKVVFGHLSIFEKLKEPDDPKVTESIELDANLGKLYYGILNFESTFKTLPSVDGLPVIKGGGLSWRVAILPFLGHEELYKEFKLDEPWNSAHNKALIAKMPREYKTPGITDPGFTAIHAVQGVDCAFTVRQARRSVEVTDGLKATALLIVGGTKTAQAWTNPEGFILDPSMGVAQLGNPTYRIFQSGDRDARTYPSDLSASDFHQLTAIADRLPPKGDFDAKYPKFGASAGRIQRIVTNLRNIDPTTH